MTWPLIYFPDQTGWYSGGSNVFFINVGVQERPEMTEGKAAFFLHRVNFNKCFVAGFVLIFRLS